MIALVVAFALAGQPLRAEPVIPVEGSTWRMSVPEAEAVKEATLHLYTSRFDCQNSLIKPEDIPHCVPFVDASRNRIHLAFDVRVFEQWVAVALTKHRIRLAYGTSKGPIDLEPEQYEITPHYPAGVGHLFVILVDRSGSMYQRVGSRRPVMELVVMALLSEQAKSRFFPEDGRGRSGVLLLTFNDEVRAADGGPWKDAEVLTDAVAYERSVRLLLDEAGGFTHLFDSIGTVIDQVLVEPDILAFIQGTQSDPALVALTDGFNNTRSDETCGDNAAPLSALLTRLRTARGKPGVLPTLYTVGFGTPYRPDFQMPSRAVKKLSPRELCEDAVDQVIDGGLEQDGIDNPTLRYLSAAGGGRSYIGDKTGELARFLGGTGTPKHDWYELDIQISPEDAGVFRGRLPVAIELMSPMNLHAEVSFFPHPLLDLPPGNPAAGGGTHPASVWEAAGVVMAGWGLTLLILSTAVGGYHLRRALFRRGVRLPGGGG